ncbi:hypothetical protein [Ruminococcus flavefaciens]|uniref:Lipocalin-like domain-containing protein n=1 Tax=Ruminococcus flavefaciens TaxID=1265 RepID=A0A1M7G4S9_RUMFL|nr:hypothetical protein [Ruminococcus flavefaciens]SHM11283.1 hypothetical protein SAMN04487860_10162 [Ruminococcus flavefaciens]
MKKIICFCLAAAMFSGCIIGCSSKKKKNDPNNGTTESSTSPETTTITDNSGKPFLGKWESYKATVLGETYETTYAGFPLSAVAQLEVSEDGTAVVDISLNPRGKARSYNYSWEVTEDDELWLKSPDDGYFCRMEQGQMIMRYADDDGTEIFLMPVSEFTNNETPTEAGLDNDDYKDFMGKWESFEVRSDGVTYTDKLGEYPVDVAFRLELFDDNTSTMAVIGDPMSYEWAPEKKGQMYMWGDFEGFSVKLENGILTVDDEANLRVKFKKVDKFRDFDFSSVADQMPEENIILDPEDEEVTTTE